MRLLFIFVLITFTHSVIAFDSGDVSLIDQYGLINTSKRRLDDWSVDSKDMDKRQVRFRAQNRDVTPWRELDPYDWLDFNTWKRNRKIKDENPDWKRFFRESLNRELVGRVIKCIGLCQNFRGKDKNSMEFMSKIEEGDEVVTQIDSAMWILLVDGTMIRVAAESSISFNEINISQNEIHFFTRLNYGYASFRSRLDGSFRDLNRPESDLAFHPLKILKANREYFMRKEYQGFNSKERMKYSVVPNAGFVSQYRELNKLIQENSADLQTRTTKMFLYTPNLSLHLENTNLDIFYGVKNSTFFKMTDSYPEFVKTDIRPQSLMVTYRGYINEKTREVTEEEWFACDPKGKSISKVVEEKAFLETLSAFTNRIPSLLMARELWLKKHSLEMLQEKGDYESFAQKFGYRLWNQLKKDELERRLAYAKEYVRRTETTTLKNMDFVFKDYPKQELTRDFFKKTLTIHYDKIKSQYKAKRILVREMTDTQYYLWTIRYGQQYLSSRTR